MVFVLSRFHFVIEYIDGKFNNIADFFSRFPVGKLDDTCEEN